ncbi:MAG TPA: helix-turn-helix transcriptional regulator [Fimbriimonas sp.]|nr:helix-turn-helix transcriptional regulator [Fimbriimonas sp.]
MEKDWLDQVCEERAVVDPEFAALNLRVDFMLQLVPVRKALGLTQEDMATKLGIARTQVAVMESRPQRASLDRIAAYARAVGARLDLVLPVTSRKGVKFKGAVVTNGGAPLSRPNASGRFKKLSERVGTKK